jgi:glucose/arabinose dehydrogenase
MKIRFTSAPSRIGRRITLLVLSLAAAALPSRLFAQNAAPALTDPNLGVRAVVGGLNTPTSMAFLAGNSGSSGPGSGATANTDFFVLEKASGKVLWISNGTVRATVLDLAVNSASERGLLGIALHPQFPGTPWVYLYWTESATGADSTALGDTTLLGNRVDRFVWNGSTLTQDINIIRMRGLQDDATNGAQRGNHNGGILRFGPDGKLYIYAGDRGRRGQLQNLPDGPGPAGGGTDDQFGGPEPDNAHLSGVVLRLNPDGTTPTDNPFFRAGALRGGEAGGNLQKVFAYGVRNGFGIAFDPQSGRLWEAQNGDDSFTEINQINAGDNLGWVQVQGPLSRLAQFKAIETSAQFSGLQQVRWSPTNIADTREQALARMFMVFEGGNEFATVMTGAEENPAVTTEAKVVAHFQVRSDGSIDYELWASGPIQQATAAHIHLGAYTQNGPIVAFLFESATPRDFASGDLIARGTLRDADVIARPNFTPTVANLAERIRQGRAYANIHTPAHPSGEARGQLHVIDREPVSHYADPKFAWKYEVAPAGVGFISGRELGPQYDGDLIVGAARDTLFSGQLFRLQLTGNRREIAVDDPRLEDRVADNLAKFDPTESESLVFGTGFGVGTDIHTGPNGNLFVVSLTTGTVWEIFRKSPGAR